MNAYYGTDTFFTKVDRVLLVKSGEALVKTKSATQFETLKSRFDENPFPDFIKLHHTDLLICCILHKQSSQQSLKNHTQQPNSKLKQNHKNNRTKVDKGLNFEASMRNPPNPRNQKSKAKRVAVEFDSIRVLRTRDSHVTLLLIFSPRLKRNPSREIVK